MPKITVSEHINASPEAVWNFISDIHRGPEWVTVMKKVTYLSEGPLREGSIYREMSKVGPSTSETEWHITKFEAPHIQVHQCRESTLQVDLTVEVKPENGGTRLLHQTDYRMMPVFRPLGWVLEKAFAHRLMTQEMNQSVTNAKHLLEAV